jgi:lipopolysaccharide transport system ATP-binding protein
MARSILTEGLSKRYQIGEHHLGMLREDLAAAFARLLGRKNKSSREFIWAVKDVSLEIESGELVGLIGRNGAGKSTLLKLLSRITYPTDGRLDVSGRVGSLLEVGTGFHDELTGRENIYLNGSILGMRRREIDATMDQIVSFADIDEFLDTPIKRYSSGMRMRLGFSVAAHLRTEVLLVDEVLAVGDIKFQKKCLGAMRELGDGGRTLIFVSHNMAAIENLCKRTIWIEGGRVKADGPTTDVIRAYINGFGAADGHIIDLSAITVRGGSGAARFTKMEFLNQEHEARPVVHSGDPLKVRLYYECQKELSNLHFGFRIFSNLGALITDANTWTTSQPVPWAPAGPGSIDLDIDFLNLMPGLYYIGLWLKGFGFVYDELENAAKLEIEASDYYGTGKLSPKFGMIFLPFRWTPRSSNSNGFAASTLQEPSKALNHYTEAASRAES